MYLSECWTRGVSEQIRWPMARGEVRAVQRRAAHTDTWRRATRVEALKPYGGTWVSRWSRGRSSRPRFACGGNGKCGMREWLLRLGCGIMCMRGWRVMVYAHVERVLVCLDARVSSDVY